MYEELLDTAMAAAVAGGRELRRFFRRDGLGVETKGLNDLVSQADHASEAAVVAEIRRRYPGHRILAEEGGRYRAEAGSGESEFEWILDPLDGTTNFVHGLPIFAVSIACRRGSDLVAAVVLEPEAKSDSGEGNLFTAKRGGGAAWNGRPMRVSGRPSLEGAFLATGFPFRVHPVLERYLEVFRRAFLTAGGIRRCGAAALDLAHVAAGLYDGFFEFRLAPWDVAAGALLIQEAGGEVSDLDGGTAFVESGNILAGPAGVHRDLVALMAPLASESLLDGLVPRTGERPVEEVSHG